jgi:hypothetical protein
LRTEERVATSRGQCKEEESGDPRRLQLVGHVRVPVTRGGTVFNFEVVDEIGIPWIC